MDFEVKFAGIGDHKKPFNMNFHTHNCHEIVLYTQGNGYVEALGEKFRYEAGSIGFMPLNVWHNEINLVPSKNVFIGFLYGSDIEMLECGFYKANELTASLFFKIVEEMQLQKKGFSLMMACQLKQLILEIIRNTENDKTEDNFSYILNYIEENLNVDISNEQLSRMSYYSTDRFRHLFKEKTGMSPKQYVMEKRLKKAEKLLAEGDKSITEISELCGFYDLAYFSKVFKNRFNMSPVQFLKTKKEL